MTSRAVSAVKTQIRVFIFYCALLGRIAVKGLSTLAVRLPIHANRRVMVLADLFTTSVDIVNKNHYHYENAVRNEMMNQMEANYDPDLPDANAVLASLCCVAARYASNPSVDLAALAVKLSRTLTAPQYAESKLMIEVAQRLVRQWEAINMQQNLLKMPVLAGALH